MEWTEHQDGIGKYAILQLSNIEQRFRWIPPGSFLMGSPPDELGRHDHEGPQHQVNISQGFWMGNTPVTQALWTATGRSNPSRFQAPNRPVEQVSWQEAADFANEIHCSLPTEAQWEYACRAGTSTANYGGPIHILRANHAPELQDIAWYGGSREVGLKRPNAWGLFDTLGNVWEWCEDGPRPYSNSAVLDPVGPSGAYRVIRGGSWYSDARIVRAANRFWSHPEDRNDNMGFRLMREG